MPQDSSKPSQSATDEKRKVRTTTEGVDAQNANEFDIRHGLAGAEAKTFSEPSSGRADRGFATQPDDDRDRRDPDERSDTLAARANPGLNEGGDPDLDKRKRS